jgi:hypothetical protein
MIWSCIPCLKTLVTSHKTHKCCSVSLLCPERELAKTPRNGLGCDLQLGIKQKIETRFKEPLSLLNFWHMILARAPLTLSSNPSEVVVFIDFDN